MNYSNNFFCQQIEEYVKCAAKSPDNYFTFSHWTSHVTKVISYAQFLGSKLNADIEICELAALLHDIAQYNGNTDSNNNHHIIGAEIAEKKLKELNYPTERIERIKRCIENHRGSVLLNAETIEEQIIKDADAMSHFDAIPSLFKVAFQTLKLNDDKASGWVKDKLERDWNKISDQSKIYIKHKYDAIKVLLD